MKRIRITTPWFSAVVVIDPIGIVGAVESCSGDELIGWAPAVLQENLERAALVTAWGRRGVTFTELPEPAASPAGS